MPEQIVIFLIITVDVFTFHVCSFVVIRCIVYLCMHGYKNIEHKIFVGNNKTFGAVVK